MFFFAYALQPAIRTSASFIGAILEEYLVIYLKYLVCAVFRSARAIMGLLHVLTLALTCEPIAGAVLIHFKLSNWTNQPQ